jgi:hypothetical protein
MNVFATKPCDYKFGIIAQGYHNKLFLIIFSLPVPAAGVEPLILG